jgi:hypothetical protein
MPNSTTSVVGSAIVIGKSGFVFSSDVPFDIFPFLKVLLT